MYCFAIGIYLVLTIKYYSYCSNISLEFACVCTFKMFGGKSMIINSAAV